MFMITRSVICNRNNVLLKSRVSEKQTGGGGGGSATNLSFISVHDPTFQPNFQAGMG